MKNLIQWKQEVSTIQGYLDESYPTDVWGISSIQNYTEFQLSWGRVICDKFVDRFIPVIEGGAMARSTEPEIEQWIRQAVEFGNASIIVSDDGNIRIPSPLSSLAQLQQGGAVLFYEELAEGAIWALDDEMIYKPNSSEETFPISDAQIFTIFYEESNLQPYGQSRLSRSIRVQTKWASRILAYSESVGYNQSHKQIIITNLQQDMMNAYNSKDPEQIKSMQTIQMGVNRVLGLAESENGLENKVHAIDPTDPSGLLKIFERIAANVASARNLEPRELGNTSAVAPSEQAQHASNEDLIMEVERYARKIKRTVHAFLVAVAEVNGEEEPSLYWADARFQSASQLLDQFSKKVAAFPLARYSKVTLRNHGFTAEEIEEYDRMGAFAAPMAGEIIQLEEGEIVEEEI